MSERKSAESRERTTAIKLTRKLTKMRKLQCAATNKPVLPHVCDQEKSQTVSEHQMDEARAPSGHRELVTR